MEIYGKRVVLKAIEPEDLDFMKDMINDPDIEAKVGGWAFPISKAHEQKWYERYLQDTQNNRLMIHTEDGVIGMATLTDFDWKSRKAAHGIKIGKVDCKGKGYGTDTVMAIMRYAFEELNLNKLEGSIFLDNVASQKLYKKCGWQIEGISRQAVYKNGQYKDMYIVGILRSEYEKLAQENNYWGKE